MDQFSIPNVPAFTQRDNKIDPSISCFPTSSAMVMQYCLNLIGKGKEAVGCSSSMQLEDYINQVISSKEVDDWMKANTSKLGKWIWDYNKRTIFCVEEYVFNLLMNPLGFKATSGVGITYKAFCDFISTNQLPCVISGDFRSVSKVQGHMNCVFGFNNVGIQTLLVNDPYGNALTGYKDQNGANMSYGLKFYLKAGNTLNVLLISKI